MHDCIPVITAKGNQRQQKSIEEEKEHVKEIEKLKEYMQTDEYIANVAREKLGMVKENEIIFSEGK